MRSIYRGLTVAGALGLATISLESQGGPPARRAVPPDSAAAQVRPGAPMRGQMGAGARGQFGPGAPMRGQIGLGARGQFVPGAPMRGQMGPGARGQFGPGVPMRSQMGPGARGQFGPGAMMRGQMGRGAGPAFNRRAQRDRMIAQRAVVRERLRNLTPEQRQQLQAGREALRVERQNIGEQLRAGTLTREQAREKLQAWRREHQPNAALRGSRPPGGGY